MLASQASSVMRGSLVRPEMRRWRSSGSRQLKRRGENGGFMLMRKFPRFELVGFLRMLIGGIGNL